MYKQVANPPDSFPDVTPPPVADPLGGNSDLQQSYSIRSVRHLCAGSYNRLQPEMVRRDNQVKRILCKALNRRSQRRSYNWKGFAELIKVFELQRPRICHSF